MCMCLFPVEALSQTSLRYFGSSVPKTYMAKGITNQFPYPAMLAEWSKTLVQLQVAISPLQTQVQSHWLRYWCRKHALRTDRPFRTCTHQDLTEVQEEKLLY